MNKMSNDAYGMVIDSLPFIDGVDDHYKAQIEREIERELLTFTLDRLHKDIDSLIGDTQPLRFDQSLYELYCEKAAKYSNISITTEQPPSLKRSLEDVVEQRKRVCPGIDIARYDEHLAESVEHLSTIAGYLRHQELVLERLLPKTVEKQWMINNDYMQHAQEALKNVVVAEKAKLKDLDQYRKSLQQQEQLSFAYLEQQWEDALVRNLETDI